MRPKMNGWYAAVVPPFLIVLSFIGMVFVGTHHADPAVMVIPHLMVIECLLFTIISIIF